MRRRDFISTLIGAVAVAGLPMPEDLYDRFLRTLRTKVIAIMRRDQTTLRRIEIDPPTCGYRFVRIWTDRHRERPLTFYHPY